MAIRAGGDGPSEACGVDSGSASSLEDPGLSSGSRGLRGVWEVFRPFGWSPGSPWRSRSRSWVLPCSPLGLRAVAGWPSGSSADSAPSMSEDISESASVAFVPVQSSCSVRVGSLRPSSPGLRLGELHPRGLRAPRFPFIDMASGVHSRQALQPRFGREGTTSSARSALVVLHHLGGFLLRNFAGLLHPAADPGVHRVSVVVDSFRAPKSSSRPVRWTSPRCPFIPLEGSSSPAAASRHRDRCLPGVRSFAFALDVTFEALLRSRVCGVALPLPAVPRPVLPGLRSPSRSSRLRFRPAPVTPKRSFSLVSIPPGVRGVAGRSLHRGAPGVCPEPKFASPKRC